MALALAQDFGAEALDLNRRLVAANPTDAASRTRLARCYMQAGQLDEAEAEYREVLRHDPRSRIAAGGLEMIEQERRRREAPPEPPHVARVPRARREAPPARQRAAAAPSALAEPVLQSFTGFSAADFDVLRSCERRDAQARFGPRVVDLIKRVNALPSSVEAAGVREPGKRQLFRAGRADVHASDAQWSVSNLGGRWEPQFNFGMHGGPAAGNWLRIGIGYDLGGDGDGGDGAGVANARNHLRRFQEVLASPRRSLFVGWMVKENGLIQYKSAGPRLDLREPSKAAAVLADADPVRTEWLFFGKWLSLEHPEDCATLSDPIGLVRTFDRVLLGLLPLWRALWE